MKLFKRSKKPGAPYYVRYWEPNKTGQSRQRVRSTGSPELNVAKQIAARFLSEAALRFHGVIDPEQERFQKEASRTIEDHLIDFRTRLATRYKGPKASVNITGQLTYIRGFADYGNVKTVGEIKADTMNRYIVHLSDLDKSPRTIEAMIGSCKHFTRWLRKHGKLRVDPLESIEKPDPESDRRLSRRMLLPTEWEWLIRATMQGDEIYGCYPATLTTKRPTSRPTAEQPRTAKRHISTSIVTWQVIFDPMCQRYCRRPQYSTCRKSSQQRCSKPT